MPNTLWNKENQCLEFNFNYLCTGYKAYWLLKPKTKPYHLPIHFREVAAFNVANALWNFLKVFNCVFLELAI